MPTKPFTKQEAAEEMLLINVGADKVVEENPAAAMANVELECSNPSTHYVICPSLL
jgi:hypothetical protein